MNTMGRFGTASYFLIIASHVEVIATTDDGYSMLTVEKLTGHCT